jgi:hypothetical protein
MVPGQEMPERYGRRQFLIASCAAEQTCAAPRSNMFRSVR